MTVVCLTPIHMEMQCMGDFLCKATYPHPDIDKFPFYNNSVAFLSRYSIIDDLQFYSCLHAPIHPHQEPLPSEGMLERLLLHSEHAGPGVGPRRLHVGQLQHVAGRPLAHERVQRARLRRVPDPAGGAVVLVDPGAEGRETGRRASRQLNGQLFTLEGRLNLSM